MNETYISLGSMGSTGMVIAALVGLATFEVLCRKRPLNVAPRGPIYVLMGSTAILSLLPLPLAFSFGLPIILFALALRNTPTRTRYYVGLAGFVFLGVFLAIPQAFSERIVLGQDSLAFQSPSRSGEVSRNGLDIHVVTGRLWYELHPSSSWSCYSTPTSKDQEVTLEHIGPHIYGSFIFWGPRGFITGDDVGRRVAQWAQAEPTVRTREQLRREIAAFNR